MTKRSPFSLFAIVFALFALVGCSGGQETASPGSVTEMVIKEITEGSGAEAKPGNNVQVHYTGWLYDEAAHENKGAKFDSSHDRGQPFSFPLGKGRVIPGWDQGVAGMKVGGQRLLIIPPHLGYGSRGAGSIPPNATLLFDVELLGVR